MAKRGTAKTASTQPKGDEKYSFEELYLTLFEQAADGIFITETSGRYREVNQRGCEMSGYKREEILQFSMTDLIPDEDLLQIPLRIDEMRSGKIVTNESHLRHKDGRLIPIEICAKLLSDGSLLGIVRDISERKKVEEEERSQLLRFPAENPNPVVRVSNAGQILYANAASAELLKEMGTGEGSLLSPAWIEQIKQLASNGPGKSTDITFKEHVYAIAVAAVPDIDCIDLYGCDVTERKYSEEALRQAEQKYRGIFENSLEGIFQSTLSGHFITVNPALARMWGYDSPEELINSVTNIAMQVFVDPEQRNEFLRAMANDEAIHGFEFQVYRKDGSKIWVQESMRTIRNKAGEFLYYEGTIRDITGQKQTEEFLRRSEERYRRTLNNMLEGCQIIDYEWRYIYVNDAAALQGRHQPEEMLLHSMPELYPGIEKTEMFSILKWCMEERTAHRMESQFTFPDGDTGWFELSVEPAPEGLFILSVDITERKQAERELRDQEAQYRTLFENLPIPVFTKDREGRYTSANNEESKYWAEDPIGRTDHELLSSEIADALKADDLRVMETGISWSGEEKFQSPDGLHYAFVRKVPLYDGAGNVIGILGASLDITEHKKAEQKRREAEQFAQSTIDALTAHICVLDENGVILSVNRAWREFAQENPPTRPDHYVGMNYLAVCEAASGEASAEAANFAAGLRAIMRADHELFSLEYPCHAPGGEKRWFVARVTRFNIEKATRIVVAHENITRRKIIEEALRDSEARFSTVFRFSPQSIAITRMRDNRLVDVNQAWVEITGISREEALGHTALELGTWFDPNQRVTLIEQLEDLGRVQGVEVQLNNSSGDVSEILFSAGLIELSGEAHMLSMALDISDRKRSEKKIRQQLNRLTTLSEIDRLIASSLDLHLTLNQLVKHVCRQLEVDTAIILLANPVTNALEFIAGEGFSSFAIKKPLLRMSDHYAAMVALERGMIHVPNLDTAEPPFQRNYLASDENYVAYFGLPLVAKGQLKGIMEIFHRQPINPEEEWLSYLESLAEQAAIAIDNAQLFNNLQQTYAELVLAYDSTIEGWSYALDLRDKETEGHTRRVTEMTSKLGQRFGLSEKELTFARWGALLHDIGKMGVPDTILQKPDELTEEEAEIMKLHPVFAAKMLERIKYLNPAVEIPYCHHEKWDGSGYPRGLKGEEIPLAARIFAVVDVWDALTSARPQRPAWSKKAALNFIKAGAGKQFDPQVVNHFLEAEELWNNTGE